MRRNSRSHRGGRRTPFSPLTPRVAVQGSPQDPFAGRTCRCFLCDIEQAFPSGAREESGWRCIQIDGVPFYTCPAHFPPDTGSAKEFEEAYVLVIEAASRQLKSAASMVNSVSGDGDTDVNPPAQEGNA